MKLTALEASPIPLVDLETQSRQLRDDIMLRLYDVIGSARYILGKEVQEFEEAFAQYCGAKHCIGVANGSDALVLALKALGVGPGDEVITAGNSFAATAFAIVHAGATPVFVDVDADDYNLDPELIEAAITEKTKAIIPVHLYGQPAKMPEIKAIAEKHGLKIVEDAAQAHGAEISGRRCGSFGDAGCFSFYPGKNLGAFGDGGAVVTNDDQLATQVRLLRNYGQRIKNLHECVAFNSRLDTMQAAVLLAKMDYIESWTDSRNRVAGWYREELSDSELELPVVRDDVRHVYHLFVVRHPRRQELLEHLQQQQIYCGIHYPTPLFEIEALRECSTFPNGCPNVKRLSEQILSLPMFPEMTREQVRRVCYSVRNFSEES